MRALLLLALLASVSALPSVASSPEAATAVQPGAVVFTSAGQCTLNFVWTDARGALYIGTAGHCVGGTGGRVRHELGQEFGTVVHDDDSNADFALIRIDADKHGLVNPAVRHWGGPTGVATAAETSQGDPVAVYGYGLVFGATEPTRHRVGVLWSDSSQTYSADIPVIFGDSGGPLLMWGTREALGVVSHLGGTSTLAGGTVANIEARLAAAGWRLTLVTAPASANLV